MDNRTLYGLVIITATEKTPVGVNRSILNAGPWLEKNGIKVEYIVCASNRSALKSLWGILSRAGRLRYDFVVFNGMSSIGKAGFLGRLIGRLLLLMKIPCFVYWHETEWAFDYVGKVSPERLARVGAFVGHREVKHLAASKACADYISRRYPWCRPVPIYECVVVPDAFDRVVPPKSPPLVVNAATIQERKGTDLFIETAIKVCKRHPTVEFTWMGGFVWLGKDKPYDKWRREISDAGLQGRIHLPGNVDSAFSVIAEASVLFLSSRDDPFPLAVLEAMCLGRTIVVFNVGGAPEALDGNGILIPPFDTDAAAEAILECLKRDPAELVNLKVRERYLANYTPEKFAGRLGDIIRRALNEKQQQIVDNTRDARSVGAQDPRRNQREE